MNLQLVRGNALLLVDIERLFDRAKANDFHGQLSPYANPHGDLISALTGMLRRAKAGQYRESEPVDTNAKAAE